MASLEADIAARLAKQKIRNRWLGEEKIKGEPNLWYHEKNKVICFNLIHGPQEYNK